MNEWTNCAFGWVPKRFRLEAFEPAADKKSLALAFYMEGWVDSFGESKELIAAKLMVFPGFACRCSTDYGPLALGRRKRKELVGG